MAPATDPGGGTYDLGASVAAGVLEAGLALLMRPVPEASVLNLQATGANHEPPARDKGSAGQGRGGGAHLALAAQFPEELLVLELAALVGHHPRHGDGDGAAASPAQRGSPCPLLAPRSPGPTRRGRSHHRPPPQPPRTQPPPPRLPPGS